MLVACSNEGVAFKKMEQSYTIGEYYAEALIIKSRIRAASRRRQRIHA